MGASNSVGVDNDEMIDNLIKSRYIRTPIVEKVFRSTDRAFYFLPEYKTTAYRDFAWKQGNLHLSAPCIYSEVLEHLKLEPGYSFLNIGSGTGYLSTLAGLILGPHGINHGIEIHADVVEYAYKKLEEFKQTCNGVDVFELCEPTFIVGNVFNLNHDRQYDRIYCGAACPEVYQEHIKKFMKIGGILVLPCEDDLLKIVRTSEETWEISSVLPVSFSTLQFPDKKTSTMISMPDPEPLGLQEMCRSTIRSLLRNIAEKEEPELTQKRKCKPKSNDYQTYSGENCVVIPVFEDSPGIEARIAVRNSRHENLRSIAFERFIRNLARNYQNLNDNNNAESVESDHRSDSENEGSDISLGVETDENETQNDSNSAKNEGKGEHEKEEGTSGRESFSQDPTNLNYEDEENTAKNADYCRPGSSSDSCETGLSATSDAIEICNASTTTKVEAVSSEIVSQDIGPKVISARPRKFSIKIKKGRCGGKIKTLKKYSSPIKNDINQNTCKQTTNGAEESTSESQPKKVMKREKLDSGISEESDDGKIAISNKSSCSNTVSQEPMEIDSDDSDFTEGSSCEENNSESETNDKQDSSKDSISLKYRICVEKKIKILPLPNAIKLYLNYNREFIVSC